MTWQELCKKAKEMGAVVHPDMFAINKIQFWVDGVIDTYYDILAESRTFEQMYQIMEALKEN